MSGHEISLSLFAAKYGDDVHVSKLKPGRVYHMRAASRRDRREWIKAIQAAAQ